MKGRKEFFFEKKNQKTFALRRYHRERQMIGAPADIGATTKVFWFFSSEKNSLLPFLSLCIAITDINDHTNPSARNGQSMKAEARRILRTAVEGADQPGENFYDRVHARFAAIGGIDLELPVREPARVRLDILDPWKDERP